MDNGSNCQTPMIRFLLTIIAQMPHKVKIVISKEDILNIPDKISNSTNIVKETQTSEG